MSYYLIISAEPFQHWSVVGYAGEHDEALGVDIARISLREDSFWSVVCDLGEEQMLTFSSIADKFLTMLGYEIKYCTSEEDARKFAAEMPRDSKVYPVYYFKSDTTGEKGYEEFFVPGEHLDMDRFRSLGIIDMVIPRPKQELDDFLTGLTATLKSPDVTKAQIVAMMQQYLPNFNHEEKGKNLDQKM